jgi:phage tail sheath protein FI
VETIEQESGGRVIRTVKTAVIGLVGTAPIHLQDVAEADRTINKLVLISNEKDAAKYFGPETAGFSIPSALRAIFEKGSGLIFVVNVFDPAIHKDAESKPDPTKVTAADIIGSVSDAGVRSGMQLWIDAKPTYGYGPKLLIAPGYTSLTGVAAALGTLESKLRAFSFVDAPVGTTVAQAIAGRGTEGTINFNVSSPRTILCYPMVKVYSKAQNAEVLVPLSQHLAGVMAAKDLSDGYWYSPSNTVITGITGLERPLTADLADPTSEVNQLNEAGIVTVFNAFGTGFRVWGNRSAIYPTDTGVRNFIPVRRTADVIEESIEAACLPFLDQPLNKAIIDAVTETDNGFLRGLKGRGTIIDGRCWFDPADNSVEQLKAGNAVYSYDFMPPTPMERVTNKATINSAYLAQLLGGK